jgi:hypothetical protein
MTYDESETKFWYHGEYEELDPMTLDEKLDQHARHCPFGVKFSAASFPSTQIIFTDNTENYK